MNQSTAGVTQNSLHFEHYYNCTQMQLSNAIASLTQQEQYLMQKIKYLEHLRNKKIFEENQEIEVLKQRINELEQEQAKQEQLKIKEPANNNMEIEEIEKVSIQEKPFEEREEIINQTITDLLGNQADPYFAMHNNLGEGKIINLLDLYM